jgi:TRAP-type transport system periplasmic protein
MGPKMNKFVGAKPWFGGLQAVAALMAATLLAVTIDAAAAQDKVMTVKLSTATLNDAQHQWMKIFAAEIEKTTGGRMKAELYPASQLGSIPRQIEGTQLGSIQIWLGPPEFLVGVDPRFELLSAPGLFENLAHGVRTIADPEFSKTFLALGANKGLIGASIFITGPVVFDMRAPMRTLADLKGKKVRVLASAFQTEQLARLGGTGISMTLGDVMPAVQQGTIDGAMSGLTVMSALQFQEAAKYITESDQAIVFSEAFYSKRWFDALPADLKAAVTAASAKAGTEALPWGIAFVEAQRKEWVAKGGELIALSAADKAELQTKMAPIGDEIVKTKPELKPLWDQLVATAKRTK